MATPLFLCTLKKILQIDSNIIMEYMNVMAGNKVADSSIELLGKGYVG